MGDDGFFEVAGRQRACRVFLTDPVPEELIERLLSTAVCAPSAENGQPWEFVVVRDAALRLAIGELTARAWEGGARQFSEDRLPPGLLADVDAGARGGLAGAPVLVVVCGNLDRGLEITLASSLLPAVQSLLLGATALGLGSALTTLTTLHAGELAALLALPPHVRPVAVVPLGRPARALGPPHRRPFTEVTHRDRFGTPW
jgi:nitroreductase